MYRVAPLRSLNSCCKVMFTSFPCFCDLSRSLWYLSDLHDGGLVKHDTFGTYLVKHADPLTDLNNAAKAGGDTVKTEVNAVHEASKASGAPISKTKAALL